MVDRVEETPYLAELKIRPAGQCKRCGSNSYIDPFHCVYCGGPVQRMGKYGPIVEDERPRRYDGCYNCDFNNDEQIPTCPGCGHSLDPDDLMKPSRPHERIAALEQTSLAALTDNDLDRIRRLRHDDRWRLESDNMSGQAIHGPNNFYLAIRNRKVAKVVLHALRGEIGELLNAIDELDGKENVRQP